MVKKLVGKVTHFYPNINVAIVEVQSAIKAGDKVSIEKKDGTDKFEQSIGSMQIEHKVIKEAKPKQVIGLKVNKEVKEGYLVYKL